MDPDHVEPTSTTVGKQCVGSIVGYVNVEEVKYTAIQIWVFSVRGKDHDAGVVLRVYYVFSVLHVICMILDVQLLVSVEHVAYNGDIAQIVIRIVAIGFNLLIGLCSPSYCISPQQLFKVLQCRLNCSQ